MEKFVNIVRERLLIMLRWQELHRLKLMYEQLANECVWKYNSYLRQNKEELVNLYSGYIVKYRIEAARCRLQIQQLTSDVSEISLTDVYKGIGL